MLRMEMDCTREVTIHSSRACNSRCGQTPDQVSLTQLPTKLDPPNLASASSVKNRPPRTSTRASGDRGTVTSQNVLFVWIQSMVNGSSSATVTPVMVATVSTNPPRIDHRGTSNPDLVCWG